LTGTHERTDHTATSVRPGVHHTPTDGLGPQGFSLIEVLFAMTLFALVGTAINVLAIGAMRQTEQNRDGTTAVMVAQQKIEDLRGLAYDDIRDRTSVVTPTGRDGTSAVTPAGWPYTIDTWVLADTPAAGMKRITVTVSWPGLVAKDTQSYVVETIFTAVSS
jgi:prepilin-type N-terminal cleavage/methylation domain-containing protein